MCKPNENKEVGQHGAFAFGSLVLSLPSVCVADLALHKSVVGANMPVGNVRLDSSCRFLVRLS